MALACTIDKWSKVRYVSETYLGVRCILRAKAGPGRIGKLSCVVPLMSPVNCEWAVSNWIVGKWHVATESVFVVICLAGL